MEPDKQAMAFEEIRSALQINGAGRLLLNGQEMVLLPRHFFRYILREVKGRSQAGAFDIELFVPDDGILHVVLTGSALIAEADLPSGHLIWKQAMLGAVRSLPNISEHTALTATMEETADGCKIAVQRE